MRRLAFPLLLGISHGISDAAVGYLVVQVLKPSVDGGPWLVLLYNGLAFGIQPLGGLFLDRFAEYRKGAAAGLILTAFGLVATWPSLHLGILLVGLGSALFHAGGGAISLISTPERASGPGVFSAFGVIGLSLGAFLGLYFSVMTTTAFVLVLIVFAAPIWFVPISVPAPESGKHAAPQPSEILALTLVLAVALRSFVWTGLQADVPGYTQLALTMALAAGAGKLLGGFISDRVGWRNWSVIALVFAMFFFMFRGPSLLLLVLGVFLLQSVIPLSHGAMGRFLPGAPGLATSLVLGLGLLFGGIPSLFYIPQQMRMVVVIVPVMLAAGIIYWLTLKKLPS